MPKLPDPSLANQSKMVSAQVVVDDLALVVMDYEHFRIHQADSYAIGYINLAVANDAKLEILISCTELTHVTFNAHTEGLAYAYLMESPTYSGGTVITPVIRNRKAVLDGNAPPITTIFKHSPTVTADGTYMVNGAIIPGGSSPARPSAGGRSSVEWLLSNGLDYVIRLVNKSGSPAWMSMTMDIYEDTHAYPGG